MIAVLDFRPSHARLIRPQDQQLHEAGEEMLTAPYGEAITVTSDGAPVACAGMVPVWPGRAYAWALLDRDVGPHMLAVTRAIRSRLDRASFARIEMAAAVDFEAASRWARLLGFERESLARKYLPDGRDAWIYVRV